MNKRNQNPSSDRYAMSDERCQGNSDLRNNYGISENHTQETFLTSRLNVINLHATAPCLFMNRPGKL